ncbi:hypothetical protein KUTeg_010764 [Tegillarca granosa]|uniref:Uncharacterized protein n=1 Tax=Tegillarca granosa TaxID=220873 RepID=A0ABQ9F1Y2_TEGGR|nr:hypothetical protein KUTeg_010764 [Tegillarca granosa]
MKLNIYTILVAFSTISSNLNALCAQTWEDILKPFLNHKSENFKSWVTRIIGKVQKFNFMLVDILDVHLYFFVYVFASLKKTVLIYGTLGVAITFLVRNGAIVGSLASYAIIMWLNVAQYSLIPAPNTNRFPSDNCSVDSLNSSFISTSTSSILTNLTTTMATTGHREL